MLIEYVLLSNIYSIYPKLLRKWFMDQNLNLGQLETQLPRYLVSRISKVVETSFLAKKNCNCHVYYIHVFSSNTCPKMLRKWFMDHKLIWVRWETQIPWYLVSRLRKVAETSFLAQRNRNCHMFIFNLSSNIYPLMLRKGFMGQVALPVVSLAHKSFSERRI